MMIKAVHKLTYATLGPVVAGRILHALVLVIGLLFLAPIDGQARKLAIIYDASHDALAAAVALAEADLSSTPSWTILERADINRILREQEITLAMATDIRHGMKLNRILGADLLAVIMTQTDRATEYGDVIIFDTDRGIRLVDAALPLDTVSAAREGLSDLIHEAGQKIEALGDAIYPIALQSIRNADFGRDMDDTIHAFGDWLERRLTQSPHVVLLERAYLKQLRIERELAADLDTRLLASATYLELEFSRAQEPGAAFVIGLLHDYEGTHIHRFTLTVSLDRTSDLANRIIQELAAHIAYPMERLSYDTQVEAARFFREAMFFRSHDRRARRGIQALEAAIQLDPENADYRFERIIWLIPSSSIGLDGFSSLTRTGEATRRFQPRSGYWQSANTNVLMRAIGRHTQAAHMLAPLPFDVDAFIEAGLVASDYEQRILTALQRMQQLYKRLADPYRTPEITALMQEARELFYHRLVRVPYVEVAARLRNPTDFSTYTEWLAQDLLARLQVTTSSYDEWNRETETILTHWLERAGIYDLRNVPVALNDLGRFLINPKKHGWHMEKPGVNYLGYAEWEQESTAYQQIALLYDRFMTDSHPVLRYYGRIGKARITLASQQRSEEAHVALLEELWKGGIELIDDPSLDPITRYQSYHAILNALMLFPFRMAYEYHLNLLDHMMTRNEFVYAVAWRASCWRPVWGRLAVEDLQGRRARIRQFLDANEVTFLYPPEQSPSVLAVFYEGHTPTDIVVKPDSEQDAFVVWPWSDTYWLGLVGTRWRDRETGVIRHYSRPDAPGEVYLMVGGGGRRRLSENGDTAYNDAPRTREDAHLFLDVIRVDLDEPSARRVQRILVHHTGLSDLFLYRGRMYMALMNSGLFEVPFEGGAAHFHPMDEAPSKDFMCLTVSGRKAYVMTQGIYFFEYDLDTEAIRILASSQRLEKQNPMDKRLVGQRVHAMWTSPDENHIYMAVADEIWRYTPSEQDYTKIAEWGGFHLLEMEVLGDGRYALHAIRRRDGATESRTYVWNPATESIDLEIALEGETVAATDRQIRRVREGQVVTPAPPYGLAEPFLWTGHPPSRINLPNRHQESIKLDPTYTRIIAFHARSAGMRALIQDENRDFRVIDMPHDAQTWQD